MPDFATSDDPAVQAQLDRLAALSLPQGRFGLETIRALLDRLGDPQLRIPPAFHVAGTNGKGSTCAFLRAMLEAEGLRVHVATSPHLVRYNERVRLAGKLIEDAHLAALLAEVLDAAEGLSPSFFEVTMAASFVAFAREPADACVIEVGLGGRFDASNVLESPVACGIASLGIDHEAFLLAPEDGVPTEPLERIAFEKASIAWPGRPLVTLTYSLDVTRTVIETAMRIGARTAIRDLDWFAEIGDGVIAYRDQNGDLVLPLPAMVGAHQSDNAALAVAMLRHQDRVQISPEAMAQGIRTARWPARMQLLGPGPLTALVPGRNVWLDGGHNADAGQAIARFFEAGVARGASTTADQVRGRADVELAPISNPAQAELVEARAQPIHLIVGQLANKDPAALVGPLRGRLASLSVVPVPGHEAHGVEVFGAQATAFPDVPSALRALPPGGDLLIAGSLYLAGEVLRLNRELPD